ncbi:hypothetical protein R1sor_000194 [Riccia sorocarpa]|uniref:RING-type domain-containing protein n=1 Tax=Riccia sorocarpa TaxID=122646 RepID=A0ABD3GSF0_9MARC
MRRKWSTEDHDLITKQGPDLNLMVYRDMQSMWPSDALQRWTYGGKETLRSMFPGWIPLSTREGGNLTPPVDGGRDGISKLPKPRTVPDIWHGALCGVCLDGFGPEGGYVSGTCPHPFHLACINQLLHKRSKCGSCRTPFHDRLWFQFCLDGTMETAKKDAMKKPIVPGG